MSGRNQEWIICENDWTSIPDMPTDDGGHHTPSKLFALCTEWHPRIPIFHHHCYYCGIFETKKRTVDKVEVKSYNISILLKNL